VFIRRSIGPVGPDGGELVAEQARILEGRGADVFMLETFYDLDELAEAIAAVKSVSRSRSSRCSVSTATP